MRQLNRSLFTPLILILTSLLNACGSQEAEQAFIEAVRVNQLNVSSLSISTVSGNSVLEADTSDAIRVMAQLDGGGELNVTRQVTLSSSDSSVLTVSTSGTVRAKSKDSTARVWAHWADLSASLPLRVSTADLISISINGSSDVSVCEGNLQYTASGNYGVGDSRNISNLVNWSVSDSALAEIDDDGVLSTYANGSVNVRASHNGVSSMDSSDFELSIRDNLASVAISPSSAQTITVGDSRQFTATANYNDASPSRDITASASWSSTNDSVISIEQRNAEAGLGKTSATGSASITASCDDNNPRSSAAVLVTVEAKKTLTDVEIRYRDSADTVDLEVSDGPIQLRAYLVYSDGSTGDDVTDSDDIEWRVSSGSSVEVNNTGNDKGEVSFNSTGRSTVEVIYDDDTYNFEDTIDIDLD